jgi:hypothetical protein
MLFARVAPSAHTRLVPCAEQCADRHVALSGHHKKVVTYADNIRLPGVTASSHRSSTSQAYYYGHQFMFVGIPATHFACVRRTRASIKARLP